MEEDKDVIWSGRPWIGPSIVARTVEVLVVGIIVFGGMSVLGALSLSLLGVPLYVMIAGVLAAAWLVSVADLLVMRASNRYVIRQNSVEVDQGIVGKRSLVVSPSAFSELEVEQGIVGRMLNYGSLEVRSQGGQQLNLRRIRDPKGVSTKVRGVMTVPTVKVVRDERAPETPPG
ncbi:MAG: PH domain-containing protein [Nitrososphaerota archaeon]|nr:PH domain-containing protein [Nitrososphaerota archaeon]